MAWLPLQFKRYYLYYTPISLYNKFMAKFGHNVIKHILGDRAINIAVETGTADAEGTLKLFKHFEKVHSIELSPALHAIALERCKDIPNIELYLADSKIVVPKLAEEIKEPVFWYLDAHWTSVNYHGMAAKESFPLWEELTIISKRPYPDIIVIDDIHSFGMIRDEEGYEDWADVSVWKMLQQVGFHNVKDANAWNDQFFIYMLNRQS